MAANSEFLIEISGGPGGGYTINVSSPSGEDSIVTQLDADELCAGLPDLQAAVLASATRSRGMQGELERPVQQLGNKLFDAVFRNSVKGLFLSSRQKAVERDEPLRLVLRIRAPELAALPWELLHDTKLGGYLCLHHPIVRYVEVLEPVAPLRVEPPLHILGMVALPGALGALDADEERESLTTALQPLIDQGLVRLDWVPGQTKRALNTALLRGCHILHFVGHGRYDERRCEGMLVFADDRGREDPLHARALGPLISVAQPRPRLIVLNSCETGASNAEDLFSSAAAELEHTVPAVVAMQFAVTDRAAIRFSGAFYEALAANRPVDEAVRAGRIALRVDKDDSLECFTPVLYQRSGDAHLFELTPPAPLPEPLPEPLPQPPTQRPVVEVVSPQPEIDTGHWVLAMAVHPDGRLLATGTRRSVQLWDTVAGQVVWERQIGGWTAMVRAVAFDPEDGKLATGSTDNTARVWDVATGNALLELRHRRFVTAVAFDATGRYLATGSADAIARVWDLATRNVVLTVRHQREVRGVAFSPDGRLLRTASEDKTARVWDAVTAAPKLQIRHKHFVLGAAFSPDGRAVATCSEDKTAQVWDAGTWTQRCRLWHSGGIRAVAFSTDGRMLATGSADGAVRVWGSDRGEQVLEVQHNRPVCCVAFYPDGRRLASAGEDKAVRNTRLPGWDGRDW